MSLSSGPAGGKGVDSSAVDTYDSGDEWDIGVGNLIIDLDADLEKDKLEMSSSKEGGGMAAPPSAVAALPDNIKFVSPVAAVQGKESKSKSKRSKNSKESIKAPVTDGGKKELQGRAAAEPPPQNPGPTPAKGGDKCSKSSRTLPAVKKDKDTLSGKAKKDKLDMMGSGAASADEPVAPMGASCIGPFEGQQNAEHAAAKQLGNTAPDSSAVGPPVAMTTDQEADDGDCRNLKKLVGVKVGILTHTNTHSQTRNGRVPSIQSWNLWWNLWCSGGCWCWPSSPCSASMSPLWRSHTDEAGTHAALEPPFKAPVLEPCQCVITPVVTVRQHVSALHWPYFYLLHV